MTTDTKQTNAPELDGEQAAAFASLQARADAQHVPGQAEPEPEAPSVPLADQISGMLGMLVGVVTPMFPSLALIYTPEAVEQVGVALQPLCEKHGWFEDGISGKYGEEVMALIVVGPLAYATYAGISSDIAARKPQKTIAAIDGPITPSSAPVAARAGDGNPGAVTVGEVIPA
jgi:hypothetical protein